MEVANGVLGRRPMLGARTYLAFTARERPFTINSRGPCSVPLTKHGELFAPRGPSAHQFFSEFPMTQTNKDQQVIRIDLTDTQKAQVKSTTGRDADAIELDVRSLEERIAPRIMITE